MVEYLCFGGVPQLVRGTGSYPVRRQFEPALRYHSKKARLSGLFCYPTYFLIDKYKPSVIYKVKATIEPYGATHTNAGLNVGKGNTGWQDGSMQKSS